MDTLPDSVAFADLLGAAVEAGKNETVETSTFEAKGCTSQSIELFRNRAMNK
jgi:hypothetical protein